MKANLIFAAVRKWCVQITGAKCSRADVPAKSEGLFPALQMLRPPVPLGKLSIEVKGL